MGVRGKPSGESLGLWGRVLPLVSPAALLACPDALCWFLTSPPRVFTMGG